MLLCSASPSASPTASPRQQRSYAVEPILHSDQFTRPERSGPPSCLLNHADTSADPNAVGLVSTPEIERAEVAQPAVGCVAGLGFVGGPSDSWARAAIGLGFTGDNAAETAVHELGHNHGG